MTITTFSFFLSICVSYKEGVGVIIPSTCPEDPFKIEKIYTYLYICIFLYKVVA